jgi:repressor LexA
MNRRRYKTLQQRGEEVFGFIKAYFNQHHKSPTYEEMLPALGLRTKSHLHQIIDYLVEEGLIEREENIPRGLNIPGWIPPGDFQIHHKGYIAANNQNPLLIQDEFDIESTVEIPREYMPQNTKPSDLFALTVQGDSMEDALIAGGDTIILKSGDIWKDGDTVAVWLANDEAVTLKEIYHSQGDTVKLKPRSHKHQPRIEKQADIWVMGRLILVMRKVAIH